MVFGININLLIQPCQASPASEDHLLLDRKAVLPSASTSEVGSAYGQSGDHEKAAAFMQIASPCLQQYSDLMPAAATAPPAPPESSKPSKDVPPTVDRGPARDDLDQYAGVYQDPIFPTRTLFVMPTCDGYQVVSPTWADSSPWIMTSIGGDSFIYKDQYNDLSVEFRVESEMRMIHNFEGLADDIGRVSPLPKECGSCHELPY